MIPEQRFLQLNFKFVSICDTDIMQPKRSEDALTGETGQSQSLNIEGAAVPFTPASPPHHEIDDRSIFNAIFREINHEMQFREIEIITQSLRIRIFLVQVDLVDDGW